MTVLNDVKEYIGIPEDETVFDMELMTNINLTLSHLGQLGLPGLETILIGSTWNWPTMADPQLNNYFKGYLPKKVKFLFDPSANTTIHNAAAKVLDEIEQRMMMRLDQLDREAAE